MYDIVLTLNSNIEGHCVGSLTIYSFACITANIVSAQSGKIQDRAIDKMVNIPGQRSTIFYPSVRDERRMAVCL